MLLGAGAATGAVFEGVFIHVSSPSPMKYWFEHESNITYNLLFDTNPEDIQTGAFGWVEGDVVYGNDLFMNTIRVQNYTIYDIQEIPSVPNKKTIKSITFVLSICGLPPESPIELSRLWRDSLSKYVTACTYSQYSFPLESNIIVGPISVPCADTCNGNDLNGWARYSMDYARSVLGIKVSKYTHQLYMLPEGTSCPWAGLGMVGCTTQTCSSWYNGGYGRNISVILHELGHNLGLQHSSTPLDPYGDRSCVMGACCETRCFNSPQSWQLGVTTPIVTLNETSFRRAKNYVFQLPSFLTQQKNFIKINITSETTETSYHISYKTPVSYDRGLINLYRYKVFIHRYSLRASPLLEGIIPRNGIYVIHSPKLNVSIKVLHTNDTSAKVQIGNIS